MFKFLVGVVAGVMLREPLTRFYQKSNLPFKDRAEAIYWIARYGCQSPETHNYGCACGTIVKENS